MGLLPFIPFNFLSPTSKFLTSFTQLTLKIERPGLLHSDSTASETGESCVGGSITEVHTLYLFYWSGRLLLKKKLETVIMIWCTR